MDCTEPSFWEERYRAGKMPWDLRGAPPALARFLAQREVRGERVLIPGCGSGYEVEVFRAAGAVPLAIDFSAEAVQRARALLGPAAEAVRQADFFAGEFGRDFDLVYERTFLCSFPPAKWPEYVRRVAGLLRPGGRLVGVFIYGAEPEPPPFPLSARDETVQLFAPFELEQDEVIPPEEVLPLYAGMERWQSWRLRG